ncbi:MAG: hypothetical protein A2X84_13115 [Desulfuromonadaceae bacterium GWC2_58_13]|nr:MAG: hypothetical protein A2X84_13115 [Desulfuromonadaceae bacterium GWC2_58_13]
MRHNDYIDACQRTEYKDMPAKLRHLQTGEVGTVIQCMPGENPEGFLVRVGQEVTTWSPGDVEEVGTEH